MSNRKSLLHQRCKQIQRGEANMGEYRLYVQFSLLAKNRFKWINLPDNIDSLHIEKYLFEYGQVAFFEDDKLGLLALPCSNAGNLNVYGEPIKFNVNGIGYNKVIDKNNMVRIRANDDSMPTSTILNYYTALLSEIENTMYMNLKQQKYPFIITTTRNNEMTMRNIYNKLEDGEDVIFVDDRLTNGGDLGIKVIETKAPYLLKDLQEQKIEVYNELLTWLGFNNSVNQRKRERLLVDEVNINNSQILMNLDLEYKNRKLACEQINKEFGLNIEVVKTVDEIEVNFIGEVHDRTEQDNK